MRTLPKPVCEICGKPRGRSFDHKQCSKILQERYLAEQKPVTWKGKEGDRVITPEQSRISRGRNMQKKYAAGKVKFSD